MLGFVVAWVGALSTICVHIVVPGDIPAYMYFPFWLVPQRADDKVKSLRFQIMFLLGSLGGQVTASMVDSTSLDERCRLKAVAWDTSQRLEFAIPFPDMKPSVFLDPFLPRVCDLAVSSSDRQTKVHCLSFDTGIGEG